MFAWRHYQVNKYIPVLLTKREVMICMDIGRVLFLPFYDEVKVHKDVLCTCLFSSTENAKAVSYTHLTLPTKLEV